MGAQLVAKAYAFAAHPSIDLKPNEMLLLGYMALTALDSDDPPVYFASRERSAYALGRMVPDEPWPDDPDAAEQHRIRAAAFMRVKVALAGLVKIGAIRERTRGQIGQRRTFTLHLDPLWIGTGLGSDSDPLLTDGKRPWPGRIPTPSQVGFRPPKEQHQDQQEPEQGENQFPARAHLWAVDNSSGAAVG